MSFGMPSIWRNKKGGFPQEYVEMEVAVGHYFIIQICSLKFRVEPNHTSGNKQFFD